MTDNATGGRAKPSNPPNAEPTAPGPLIGAAATSVSAITVSPVASWSGPGTPAGQLVPPVPSEAEMSREIVRDRRHERYLVRAAIIAVLIIAIAIAVRVSWG